MIFLVQFGIKSTHKFFKDYKLHSPYGLVQFFVIFEKFTRAYLFQIALEIIWLPIRIVLHSVLSLSLISVRIFSGLFSKLFYI